MRPIEPISFQPKVVKSKETLIEEFHKYLDQITESIKTNPPKSDLPEMVASNIKPTVKDQPRLLIRNELDNIKQPEKTVKEKSNKDPEKPVKADKNKEKPKEISAKEENPSIEIDVTKKKQSSENSDEVETSDRASANVEVVSPMSPELIDAENLEAVEGIEKLAEVSEEIVPQTVPVITKDSAIADEVVIEEAEVGVENLLDDKHQKQPLSAKEAEIDELVEAVPTEEIVSEIIDSGIKLKKEEFDITPQKLEKPENFDPITNPSKEINPELMPARLLISNLVDSTLMISGNSFSNGFNNGMSNKNSEGLNSKISSIVSSASVESSQGEKKSLSKLVRIPPALEARTLKRVEQVLNEVASLKESKSISFRLDPPTLGSVKVDISLKDGALHARIVPESSAVGNFLREQAHELVISLRKLGLNVEKVAVSIGTDTEERHSEQRAPKQKKGKSTGKSFNYDEEKGSDLDHWVA
jgi:flagellar hook-length control protein FliK